MERTGGLFAGARSYPSRDSVVAALPRDFGPQRPVHRAEPEPSAAGPVARQPDAAASEPVFWTESTRPDDQATGRRRRHLAPPTPPCADDAPAAPTAGDVPADAPEPA